MRRVIFMLVASLFVGCSSDTSDTTGAGADTIRIGVSPKGTSHEFWRSIHAGAEQAAKEAGNVEIVWKGPQVENDTAGQINVMKNFITKNLDGIVLAPNHSDALVEVVAEAGDAEIPVVIFDSGLGEGAEIASYVSTDNFNGGKLAAKRLAEVLNQKGKVIMIRYRAGSESTEQREEGFLVGLKEFPEIEVLSSDQYGEATTQSALEKSTALLNKYKDQVTGVFAVCEPNCNGMLEALQQSGLAGKVKFVAFDPSESLIQGLKDGNVHGIVLQDPVQMGYQAVKTMLAKLAGESVEPVISTGEHVATADNMDTEQFQKLLNPIQFEE